MQDEVNAVDDETMENFESSEGCESEALENFEQGVEDISQDENLDENEASVQEESFEKTETLPIAKSLKDGKSCRLKTEGEKLSKIIRKTVKAKKTEPKETAQAELKKGEKRQERTKRNAKVQQKAEKTVSSGSGKSRKDLNGKSGKSTSGKKNDKSSSSYKKANSKSNKSSKKNQQKKKSTKYEL